MIFDLVDPFSLFLDLFDTSFLQNLRSDCVHSFIGCFPPPPIPDESGSFSSRKQYNKKVAGSVRAAAVLWRGKHLSRQICRQGD